jgi:hypothetical protein
MRTLHDWFLNRSAQAKVLYFIDPFIKLDRCRIAFAATAAAGGARGQLAKVALADPFAEHAAQRFGIDVEMICQIDQCDAALFLDVIAQVR